MDWVQLIMRVRTITVEKIKGEYFVRAIVASGDNLRMEDDESSTPSSRNDEFGDAPDEFPFHDCVEAFSEPIESDGCSSISTENPNPSSLDEIPSPTGLRRRRSQPRHKPIAMDSNDLSKGKSSVTFENEVNSVGRRRRHSQIIRQSKAEESSYSEITEISELPIDPSEKDERNGDRSTPPSGEYGNSHEDSATDSSLLMNLAGIVIKLVAFQINLFVNLFTFPVKSVYYLYMFVFDPFGLSLRCKQYVVLKVKGLFGFGFEVVTRSAYEWLKEHQAVWKLGLKCGWGLLWSAYVCAVLVTLLISSFVIGGILIKTVVVEPVRINRSLNFDYVENSPAAIVMLTSKPEFDQVNIGGSAELGKASETRVIPLNHKFRVAVSLTLPESDYNRNLGIFQVRVDFHGADGKTLASSKQPCMLHFRSPPIRLLLTLFKLAPILTGYTSETQNLKVHFRGFTERDMPTAYLRVIIEQRAEFSPGAGVPEIYDASLTLESELPLLLHILWFWKRTLFIWISMAIFAMELLVALLCCKPLVLPKLRLRNTPNRDASDNDSRARR
ncbi:seipin-2 [Andrographis paniculata]|uniref:seipin-2 n=1 Tax=Andrographis paniculata TaxID=175694 RepID=UPI0021E92754|nr:seipin-2 [Andrographis paniculata]